MWRDVTVGRKIGIGFGIVLCLLVGLATAAYLGIGSMGASTDDALSKNRLAEELAQKEIDHLSWATQLGRLLNDPEVTTLSVETDPHKCAFGQWLYGPQRAAAEEAIPEIAPLLAELERRHSDLHATAVAVGSTYREADLSVGSFLRDKKNEHLAWLHRVKDAFVGDAQTGFVDVEVDAHRCGLGQWLDSPAVAELTRADADFAKAVGGMTQPHAALHASAGKIAALLADGDRSAAQRVFSEQTAPLADQTLTAIDEVLAWHDAAVSGRLAAERTYVGETLPALARVQQLLQQVADAVHASAEEANRQTRSTAAATQRFVAGVSLAAVILGLSLALVIARGVVRTLRRVIGGLDDGASQVREAAAQVAASSQQLAEGASEQASSLEETSSALEEMSAMTRTNADKSRQVDEMAVQARSSADEGGRVVAQLNDAMHGIRGASEQVGKIVKVIQEIAFQTNLLALNAAVEAARAGEHGKGFAVVADEVRNLAQRSAGAADEITDLIKNSSEQSQTGVRIAGEVGGALEGILANINDMSGLISGIAQANSEQAEGVEQVNLAVSQMDKVTQQNAANAEESASASEQLAAQASTVTSLVGDLRALIDGAQRRERAAAAERTAAASGDSF